MRKLPIFIFFAFTETSRRQRDSQCVSSVSVRGTRTHNDVNSRLYVRSGEKKEEEEAEEEKDDDDDDEEEDYIGRH